jgi:hypothetical protein
VFLRFVLLKEKNMLLTMEHECREQTELFPNPERIDKVRTFNYMYNSVTVYYCDVVVRVMV